MKKSLKDNKIALGAGLGVTFGIIFGIGIDKCRAWHSLGYSVGCGHRIYATEEN